MLNFDKYFENVKLTEGLELAELTADNLDYSIYKRIKSCYDNGIDLTKFKQKRYLDILKTDEDTENLIKIFQNIDSNLYSCLYQVINAIDFSFSISSLTEKFFQSVCKAYVGSIDNYTNTSIVKRTIQYLVQNNISEIQVNTTRFCKTLNDLTIFLSKASKNRGLFVCPILNYVCLPDLLSCNMEFSQSEELASFLSDNNFNGFIDISLLQQSVYAVQLLEHIKSKSGSLFEGLINLPMCNLEILEKIDKDEQVVITDDLSVVKFILKDYPADFLSTVDLKIVQGIISYAALKGHFDLIDTIYNNKELFKEIKAKKLINCKHLFNILTDIDSLSIDDLCRMAKEDTSRYIESIKKPMSIRLLNLIQETRDEGFVLFYNLYDDTADTELLHRLLQGGVLKNFSYEEVEKTVELLQTKSLDELRNDIHFINLFNDKELLQLAIKVDINSFANEEEALLFLELNNNYEADVSLDDMRQQFKESIKSGKYPKWICDEDETPTILATICKDLKEHTLKYIYEAIIRYRDGSFLDYKYQDLDQELMWGLTSDFIDNWKFNHIISQEKYFIQETDAFMDSITLSRNIELPYSMHYQGRDVMVSALDGTKKVLKIFKGYNLIAKVVVGLEIQYENSDDLIACTSGKTIVLVLNEMLKGSTFYGGDEKDVMRLLISWAQQKSKELGVFCLFDKSYAGMKSEIVLDPCDIRLGVNYSRSIAQINPHGIVWKDSYGTVKNLKMCVMTL